MENNKLVLIVDDNQDNLQVLANVLKDASYQIALAKDGEQALDFVAKREPDLILLDIMMPNLNGFEVCQRLKSDQETKEIPVIFISALKEVEDKLKGFEVGGVDYITKPFEQEIVLTRVKTHLELSGMREELKIRAEKLKEANQKLAKMATIDSLTQIANRKLFDDTLKQEWNRAKRNGHQLALLMIDADNFKNYNDTHGHQAGDECLKRLAEVFAQQSFRSSDLAARFGGDEFVIILAETDLEGAKDVAQRVRTKVEELRLEYNEAERVGIVTVSIGLAVAEPKTKDEQESLLGVADRALYRAKEAGKNKIKVWDEIIK